MTARDPSLSGVSPRQFEPVWFGTIAAAGAARVRFAVGMIAVASLFVGLAMLRAPDHDESQYVASAALVASGLLPYRDFAFLQTPLQPLLFAPLVAIAKQDAWLTLRVVNALLGVVILYATYFAARLAGAGRKAAAVASGLMATCDIFLFSIGTARNDALPAALLALALLLLVRPAAPTRVRAAMTGLLLAAAAAAKISYAIPAIAVGVWALTDRRQRPLALLAGAAPIMALCVAIFATAPAAAWFEVVRFPSVAPSEYYAAVGKDWRLGLDQKVFDLTKFMMLGPAALGLAVVVLNRQRVPRAAWILLLAGLAAAALPTPTWRQYLLPVLPPLFVLLAVRWTQRTASLRTQLCAAVLAAVGTAPTLIGVAAAVSSDEEPVAITAAARAVGAALDQRDIIGPVATLSPQFLPAAGRLPDPRFAAGPFYFRSRGLLASADERRALLLGRDQLSHQPLPAIVLVGGEAEWTSGNERLDALLERSAVGRGYERLDGTFGPFRVYVRPQSTDPRCQSLSEGKERRRCLSFLR